MLYCFAKLVYCIQCDLNSEQAVAFAKDFRGCILSDGYFLNAPVYSGRAEEGLLHRPALALF